MKYYTRYHALYYMASTYGWNWVLTSMLDKAKAYELNQHGELTITRAVHVIRGLYGADKLSSAFSISPKGFEVLLKLYFDRIAIQRMLKQLFNSIFTEPHFLNKFLKRQNKHY